MANSEKKSFEIAESFTRYLESNDMSLIEHFARDDIEIALLQLIKNGDSPYYLAMKIRREELKEIEEHERGKWVTWKYNTIVFIVGLILGFVLLFLKLIYFS